MLRIDLVIFILFNILVLISVVTIFTIHPYWKGFKITFFYFTDYLCYFGILTFIIFTSIINDKRLILFAYCILGYYLNEGLGQSTKSDSKQPVERTVIELRYGFNILEPHLVSKTREYDVENIIIDDKKIPVSNYVKL